MFDTGVKESLVSSLRELFPEGPQASGPSLHATRHLVETVVALLEDALTRSGTPVRLVLETEASKVVQGAVTGLIIFKGKTTGDVAMTLSPYVARLNGKPQFLGHAEGAVNFLEAVLDEIDAVLVEELVDELRRLEVSESYDPS